MRWVIIFLCLAIMLVALPACSNESSGLSSNTVYLEVQSWHWSRSYGYIEANGLVKNISDEPLYNVECVIYCKDGNLNFIKSDSALIDYDVLLPGQSSPFTVMTIDNPAIEKASIQFREFWGSPILHINSP